MPNYDEKDYHRKRLEKLYHSRWELVVSVWYYKDESPVTKTFKGNDGGAKAATDKAAVTLGRLLDRVYRIKSTIKMHKKAGGTRNLYDKVQDSSRTTRPSDQPKSKDIKFW